MRAPVVLCSVALGLFAGAASAWGPGAHAYVVRELSGDEWPLAIMASTMPDMVHVSSDPAVRSNMQYLTHHEYDRLPQGVFAMGFTTHNGDWGADWYAHCYYQGVETTYLTSRMRIMADEFGITMTQAEDVLEPAVDYLVGVDHGLELGPLIELGLEQFGETEVQQLVDAYAQPLSDRVPGLSVAEAENEIRTMSDTFAFVLQAYAQQLVVHDVAYIRWVALLWVMNALDVDQATADLYLSRAEELCWDYEVGLGTIVSELPSGLATLGYDWYLILEGPVDAKAYVGDAHTFAIEDGYISHTPSYQWKWDDGAKGVHDVGVDAPWLTLTDLSPIHDAGRFWCEVSYDGVAYVSNTATLAVRPPLVIASHPDSATETANRPHTLSVQADGGYPPLSYAWWKDGNPIAEATDPSLTIARLRTSDTGTYHVVVCDANTAVVSSNTALLTVEVGVPASGWVGIGVLLGLLAAGGAGSLRRRG